MLIYFSSSSSQKICFSFLLILQSTAVLYILKSKISTTQEFPRGMWNSWNFPAKKKMAGCVIIVTRYYIYLFMDVAPLKLESTFTLPSFSLSLEEEEEKKSRWKKEQQKSCGRVYGIHAWLNYLAFFFFPSLSFFCITQEWRGLGCCQTFLFYFSSHLFCFLHFKN